MVGRLNWNVSICCSDIGSVAEAVWLGLFAGGLHGRDDVGVSAAAADVAVHGLLDVVIGGADGFFEESDGRHDLAGGTVAALVSVVLDEGSLHGVKIVRLADAFDGGDLVHRVHDGEGEAGVHAAAVDVYGAGAALAVVATLLCAGHVEVFAQAVEQRGARVDVQVVLFAVDAQSDRDCAFNPVRAGGCSRRREQPREAEAKMGGVVAAMPAAPMCERNDRRLTRPRSGWAVSGDVSPVLLCSLAISGLYWIFSHGNLNR